MDNLDELDGEELVRLAMLAFIYMHDKKKVPKEQLLDDILNWFRMMTDDMGELEVHEVILGNTTEH